MTERPTNDVPTAEAPRRRLWMRLLGIRRRQGRFLRFKLTRWGWVVAALVVMVGGMGAFAEYTMTPDFCRSCHIMEPYYVAWHKSTHKDVPCAMCHFEPGLSNTLKGKFQASSQAVKYLTGTYGSKPHAEIQDVSCLRAGCHERRVLEGKVTWEVASQRGGKVTIRFDHTPHLKTERRGKDLRCVSCHSQIVQGQHLVVTLNSCFLCHFKGLEHGRNEKTLGGCRSCHDAPKEKIRLSTGLFDHGQYIGRGVTCENCHSDSIRGNGAVSRQVCWSCHNQAEQVGRYGEMAFLHDSHVTKHKVECSSCHEEIEHGLVAGAAYETQSPAALRKAGHGGQCAQCHEQSHAGPAELYRGIGGRGVPDMPSPMFRTQVDCIACHKARKRSGQDAGVVGQTFVAVQDSCDYCHGSKYKGQLEQWKKTVEENLRKAEDAHELATTAVKAAALDDVDRLRAQRLLADAAHNIRLVKLGHGVHNVNYATALTNCAVEKCKEALAILRVPQPKARAQP